MSEKSVLALVAILIGSAAAFAIRVAINVRNRKTDNSNEVKQSGNKVGGDQAGRDIKK